MVPGIGSIAAVLSEAFEEACLPLLVVGLPPPPIRDAVQRVVGLESTERNRRFVMMYFIRLKVSRFPKNVAIYVPIVSPSLVCLASAAM